MDELNFIFKMPDEETLAKYISIKGEKGEKGDPTKLSQLDNDTGFVTASTDELTNYYTKAQTDGAIDDSVAAIGVPDGFFTDDDTESGEGYTITLNGTASATFKEVKVYGDTKQDGTPTPDNPVEIEVVTGLQTLVVSGSDDSQTYEIDLGALELAKIGNYQDYFYKSEGKWYLHKAVGKADLSTDTAAVKRIPASGSWKGWSIRTAADDSLKGSGDVTALLISNKLVAGDRDSVYQGDGNNKITLGSANDYYYDFFMRPTATSGLTVSQFQTWLVDNPIVVYYALSVPYDEEVSNDELLSQLNDLGNAKSYDGYTNIEVTGSLPALLYAEAFKNDWSGTVSSIDKALSDLDDKKADRDDTYNKDEVDAKLDESYIIKDITVTEYYDEQMLTHYWITHVPNTDSDGNFLKMKMGTAKDVEDDNLRWDETVRSFAKRHNATLCINAGLGIVNTDSAYYKCPTGVVIKDKNVICDFRDAIWDEGIATHTYLQKNRMLAVSDDNSLQRFDYDAQASDILNAGADYTITGFGAFLQNGKLTSDLSHASDPTATYEPTTDETPNINKIYFTLVEAEYVGHWRLEDFEDGVTYYEQVAGDFYAWQLLGQNTTTKEFYIFTCNGKGTTSELGMSFEQAVAIFQALGCDWGFQLDAGGSVALCHNGLRLNNATDGMTDATSKTDGRGLNERECVTMLYWSKEPATGSDDNTASIYKDISDLMARVYDLEVKQSGNEVVTNDRLFINDKTDGNQTAIVFQRDGTSVFSIVADYLKQGIFGLWDGRNSRTVLRLYPDADNGIEFMGDKMALLYDQTKDGGSSTNLNSLPFHTGIIRLNANYNLENAPFVTAECAYYYIIQLCLNAGGYNQRIQIAIPQIKRNEINDAIKIRGFTTDWGEWRYLTQTRAVSTANRPTMFLRDGMMIFDTTLGKPIWYNGGSWYDATGTAV